MRAILIALFAVCALFAHVDATCTEGTTTPHPTDCNAFQVCNAGAQLIRRCPGALHFNALLLVCDHAADAGCEFTVPSTEEPLTVPAANDCPAVGGNVILPHPNCRRFYMCDYGTPIERECAASLEWNAAAGTCDWPAQAGCVAGAAPPQSGAILLEPTPAPTVAPSTTTNTAEPITEPSTATEQPITEQTATAQPITEQQTPAQPITEPSTATAKPITEQTATAQPITEQPTPTPAQPITEQPTPAQPITEQTATSQPITDKPTPAQPITEEPAVPPTPEHLTTENALTYRTDCDTDLYDFLPHPDCRMFYICVVGRPVELTCPADFYFNVKLEHCVRAEEAQCVDGEALPQREKSELGGHSDWSTENPDFPELAATPDTTAIPDIPDIIVGSTDEPTDVTPRNDCATQGNNYKYFAHPNCNQYYLCVYEEPVELKCYGGNHYNSAQHVCITPELAGCVEGAAPQQV